MSNKILTKSDIQKAAIFWHATSHTTYNYQRLQAGALAATMGPILAKLYPNNKDKVAESCTRNMLYFNTEPRIGAVIPGMVVALEEGLATDTEGEFDSSIITEIKTALMGPLAGVGDTVWAGLLKPVILSITLAWAMEGNIWGAWAYGIIGLVADFAVTYFSFMRGYDLGVDSVDKFLESGFIKKVITFLGIVGLFSLGGMIVKFVSIQAVLEIPMTTGVISINSVLNKFVPSFLPLAFTMFAYWLQVKGKKITSILLILFVVGFIGGALGLIG